MNIRVIGANQFSESFVTVTRKTTRRSGGRNAEPVNISV